MLKLFILKLLLRCGQHVVLAIGCSTVLLIVILFINDYHSKTTIINKMSKEFYPVLLRRLQNLTIQTQLLSRQNVFKSNRSNMTRYVNAIPRDNNLLNVEKTIAGLGHFSNLKNNTIDYVNLESKKDKFLIWIPKPEQKSIALSEDPFRIENVNICLYSDIDIVILVHSAVENFKRRSGIRQTWGNATTLISQKITLVFLLGLPEKDNTQKQVENENEKYKDIVQGKFRDTYHNLTHKAVLGLRWLQDNCESVKYVVKIDDDVFINTYLFYSMVKSLAQNPNKVYCKRQEGNTLPIKRSGSKWIVSEHEFKNLTIFPLPYCHGFFVMMGGPTALRLYQASKSVPFFWIDDFYVYGMLSDLIGLRSNDIYNIGSELSLNTNDSLNCFAATDKLCDLLVGTAPSFEFMITIWEKMKKQYTDLV